MVGAIEGLRMVMAQLTSSPFFGGPERQMLGLALAMPADYKMVFLLFRDKGKSQAFRSRLEENGLETHLLEHHTPHVPAMVSEIAHGFAASLPICSAAMATRPTWSACSRLAGLVSP